MIITLIILSILLTITIIGVILLAIKFKQIEDFCKELYEQDDLLYKNLKIVHKELYTLSAKTNRQLDNTQNDIASTKQELTNEFKKDRQKIVSDIERNFRLQQRDQNKA